MLSKHKYLSLFFGATLIVMAASCKPVVGPEPNANANANSQPANSNTSSINSNSSSSTTETGLINAKEPEKYSATLVFSVETAGGDKAIGIPPLTLQVGRNGSDRRIEFKLPDGTPLIYLDHDNHHYVILPARKQYAELSKEATGIQMHKMLTPGQLVESLKNVKGIERVGEETVNGRTAEKYRYSRTTNTNTKAGEVKAEAFVFVDKETGLPLRSEIDAESSGDVKGVNSARVVAEMRDIKTVLEPTSFELPQGYAQVAPEKIRQQIDALTSAVATVLKGLLSGTNQSAPAPSPAK